MVLASTVAMMSRRSACFAMKPAYFARSRGGK
jgi:hypothetical protein